MGCGGTLAIIVPFRNRLDHLQSFAPYMETFLWSQHDMRIVVIEQGDRRPFNRGALLNAGFRIVRGWADWVAFHDIDMLPLDTSCDYSRPAGLRHLAGAAEQFGYRQPYRNYIGGVLLSRPDIFESVNGFSNGYWGWGSEDDDLYLRFWSCDIDVEHAPGRYRSLAHMEASAIVDNYDRFRQVLRKRAQTRHESVPVEPRVFRRAPPGVFFRSDESQHWSADGLSTLRFTVVENMPLGRYTGFSEPIDDVHQVFRIELDE
jgi:hypothetical protein